MVPGCGNPYTQVPIASNATISQEWTEIRPPANLRWTEPVEEFSFHIDSPYVRSPQAEIVVPSGEHFIPDVEFVTTSGMTYVTNGHGFWGEDMFFSLSNGQPGMEPIQTIRIRSTLPLRISNLVWRGYDPAKVKR